MKLQPSHSSSVKASITVARTRPKWSFPDLLLQALQLPLHLLQLGIPVLHLGLRAGAARLSCSALLLCSGRG